MTAGNIPRKSAEQRAKLRARTAVRRHGMFAAETVAARKRRAVAIRGGVA